MDWPLFVLIFAPLVVLAAAVIVTWVAIRARKRTASVAPQARVSRQEPIQAQRPTGVVPSARIVAPVAAPRINVSGIGVSISFQHEQAPVHRPRRGPGKLIWYAPGETLIHAGLIVDSGMFYASERSLVWPGEPSAIVTSLAVGQTAAHPLQDFGYYPAYDRITAEQRRCYLEWLAGGRQDSDPSQRSLGHVFLFFYGLEHRIIVEGDRDLRLLDEVIRLLQHYGPVHKSRSLKSYLLQLLHFAGWQLGLDQYRALWPRLLELDGDRPDEDGLRFVLANLHQRGEALDWTVAYRIALASEESKRSTVVTRTQEKFFALFQQRFSEHFAGGFVPEAAKQETLVQYRPASAALSQMRYGGQFGEGFDLRIPNVIGLHRQFNALPMIWNSCVDDLSGYSRALASKKRGQGAALATWQSLPTELRRTEDHPLKDDVDDLLARSPREGDYVFVPTAALAVLSEIPERAKLTTAQGRQVVELMDGVGWQIAPNPEVTGLPLSWDQELALYRKIEGKQRSEHVVGLTRLLYLAMTLAAADGAVESQELETFYQLITSQITDEKDWRSVRATEASLRRDAHVALRSLPQVSKLIPAESRPFVLRTMAHIAGADSEVSLDELKVLRRMARAFELDPDAAEKLLREDEAFREVTIMAPERRRGRGETLPSKPSDKASAFALNQDRIKALTKETLEVISLLSIVMAEPEAVPCHAPSPPPTLRGDSASAEWLNGLDPRYHPAVLTLVCFDQIMNQDFDCLAADHHLLPDDLFNAVNVWADESFGDFLLERGENIRIFRDLLPDRALPVAA